MSFLRYSSFAGVPCIEWTYDGGIAPLVQLPPKPENANIEEYKVKLKEALQMAMDWVE